MDINLLICNCNLYKSFKRSGQRLLSLTVLIIFSISSNSAKFLIHSNSVIGSDGFGYAPDGNGIYIKTFHSLCFVLLRKHIFALTFSLDQSHLNFGIFF